METDKTASTAALLPVKISGEKASDFRTIHSDGVWGLPAGTDGVYLVFYTEHPPIPDMITLPIDPETGSLSLVGSSGFSQNLDPKFWNIARTFQAEVALTREVAQQLHGMLSSYLAQLDKPKS